MKSLNGLLFIIIGGAVIWIGATGRLSALAAALGMVRNAPGNGGTQKQDATINPFADVLAGSSTSTGASASNSNSVIGLTPKAKALFDQSSSPLYYVDAGPYYYNVLGLK